MNLLPRSERRVLALCVWYCLCSLHTVSMSVLYVWISIDECVMMQVCLHSAAYTCIGCEEASSMVHPFYLCPNPCMFSLTLPLKTYPGCEEVGLISWDVLHQYQEVRCQPPERSRTVSPLPLDWGARNGEVDRSIRCTRSVGAGHTGESQPCRHFCTQIKGTIAVSIEVLHI